MSKQYRLEEVGTNLKTPPLVWVLWDAETRLMSNVPFCLPLEECHSLHNFIGAEMQLSEASGDVLATGTIRHEGGMWYFDPDPDPAQVVTALDIILAIAEAFGGEEGDLLIIPGEDGAMTIAVVPTPLLDFRLEEEEPPVPAATVVEAVAPHTIIAITEDPVHFGFVWLWTAEKATVKTYETACQMLGQDLVDQKLVEAQELELSGKVLMHKGFGETDTPFAPNS